MSPIQNEKEFVQCLEALLGAQRSIAKAFLVLPEDYLHKHYIELRRLIRDYLIADTRL